MKADQINSAHNPLLPAALVAIRRSAQRARREALLTHTAIVIVRNNKIERIRGNQIRESCADYDALDSSSTDEGST